MNLRGARQFSVIFIYTDRWKAEKEIELGRQGRENSA